MATVQVEVYPSRMSSSSSSPVQGAPEEALARIDSVIDTAFANVSLQGWCTPEKAKRMARLIPLNGPPPRCVELGVFGGRGCIALGLGIKFLRGGAGTVDGIDPFTAAAALEGTNAKADQDWWSKLDYATILGSARGWITKLDLDGIVRLRVHRSQDVVDDYVDRSIDVLHQDSNHSEEISCYEVLTWTPKIRPGGIWVFDDIDWPTTRLAQKRLVSDHGFQVLEQHAKWAVFQAPHPS